MREFLNKRDKYPSLLVCLQYKILKQEGLLVVMNGIQSPLFA